MKKFLFQGDSITDAGRGTEPTGGGYGYVTLIKSHLMYNPENVVYNCGVSGNRIVDMYARWKKDCINLEPDVLTIMIGVNDVWHELDFNNGVDAEKFEMFYRLLLDETKKLLPDTRIILMGSYLMHGTATDAEPCGYDQFAADVKVRRDITEKLAKEYGLEYIDLQKKFDDAIENIAPASHWTPDGVHPSAAGYELIKRAWLENYEN